MHMRTWKTAGAAGACLVVAGWALVPSEARACGGMFCDSGPTAMPVDQTGENILFATVPGSSGGPAQTEAHIQIQYTGDAARFAWVIPVQSVPTFSVGSQPLFDALLAGSVPTYGTIRTAEFCGTSASSSSGSSGFAGGGFGSSSSGGGGVQVLVQERVGTLDVTVLESTDSAALWEWLATNGYQQPETARPILDEYVQSGHKFAAFKLTRGGDVDELHPVVMRFTGRPCVPLKLTAIAATADMGVRVFHLGTERMVPTGYTHVEINPLRLDWITNASNYRALLTDAVDDPASGGRGFVTEYAGDSTVVNRFGVADTRWNGRPFRTQTPEEALAELEVQGLAVCGFGGFSSSSSSTGGGADRPCVANHPLLMGILRSFYPADAVAFWQQHGSLSGYTGTVDPWDAPGLADALTERIFDPGRHAAELLAGSPMLTRLFMTISPAEMTDDPEFVPWPDLKTVAAQRFGTQVTSCSGPDYYVLPDGQRVALTEDGRWPDFSALPAALLVERFTTSGLRETLADRSRMATEALDTWNTSRGLDVRNNRYVDCACASTRGHGAPGAVVGVMVLGLALVRGRRRGRP